MSRPPVRIACLASTLLAASSASATEQPVDANSEPPPPSQEEVLVVGRKGEPSTEMTPETAQLLGIAGAANDPLQAIFALPGVTFSPSDGPGGSEPVTRGSAPQDHAYFIDLIPASYLFHLFGNSIFDQHVISSFNLYPAAFPQQVRECDRWHHLTSHCVNRGNRTSPPLCIPVS